MSTTLSPARIKTLKARAAKHRAKYSELLEQSDAAESVGRRADAIRLRRLAEARLAKVRDINEQIRDYGGAGA